MTSNTMKNILDDLRKGSDLLWAFRELKIVDSYTSQRSSKSLKDLCNKVQELVIVECIEEGDHKLSAEVKSLMEEIRCSYNLSLVRFLGIIFSKLLKHFYSGIFVNEERLFKLKDVIGNSPVILVPSHRSYCDFIIMTYICFVFEIEIPCVAAAIDFSSMKFIGNILRDCKAFFIRRNFNGDTFYKNIFQKFLQYLIINGNSPVEFFIEGTRSRTGKALPPKFGLLKTVMDTFMENDIPDLIMLPIGISYDRVLEDRLFSYELLGIPKPPESTKGFFQALATMDEKYGNIYVNVGEPIFLKSFLKKHSLFHNENSWAGDSSYLVEKIGFHIVKEQQKLQKILCVHLLSLLLHGRYMENGHISLNFDSACSLIQSLKAVLHAFGSETCLSDNIKESLNECLTIHKSLVSLLDDGTITLANFDIQLINVHERKLKGAKLNENVLLQAMPMLCIQQYINPLLTVLASPVLLIALAQNYAHYDILLEKYKFFREIFLNEFIFIKENWYKDFQSSLEHLVKLGLIKLETSNHVTVLKENKLSFILSSILYPFIITYLCTCQILMDSAEKKTLDNILKSSQLLIQDKINNKSFYHHASLSLDSISQVVATMLRLQVILKDYSNDSDVYVIVGMDFLKNVSLELDLIIRGYDFYKSEIHTSRSIPSSKL